MPPVLQVRCVGKGRLAVLRPPHHHGRGDLGHGPDQGVHRQCKSLSVLIHTPHHLCAYTHATSSLCLYTRHATSSLCERPTVCCILGMQNTITPLHIQGHYGS